MLKSRAQHGGSKQTRHPSTLMPPAPARHAEERLGCRRGASRSIQSREAAMPLSREQQAEIAIERGQTRETRRATVPALEEILYEAIPVLDHGFIRVVDYMGDDAAIVQAARISYGRGTKRVSEDKGLINYLMRHRHTTPFEMCEIKYHVKLPIFVARQWIRHRTANVNEYSARYSVLDKEFYIPSPEHLAAQSVTQKQGREEVLEPRSAWWVLELLREDAEHAYDDYTKLLNQDEAGKPRDPTWPGLARELARMNLSLNFYTQWYWKIDLYNLFHFLSLRADPHAQYEIRAYAEAMLETVKRWVPMAYDAFREYRMNAATISATGLQVIRRMLAGETVDQAASGLSPREYRELMALLNGDLKG
jgi:thymidylate synthase (FAD)